MEQYKTIYKGDMDIDGEHTLPVTMWSEKVKLDKPLPLLPNVTHKYHINFQMTFADEQAKNYYIGVLRKLIKNKIED